MTLRSCRAEQLLRNIPKAVRPPDTSAQAGRIAPSAADCSASQVSIGTMRRSSCEAVALESAAIPRDVASPIAAPGRPAWTRLQKELDIAQLSSRAADSPERCTGSAAPNWRKFDSRSPNLPWLARAKRSRSAGALDLPCSNLLEAS